MAIFLAGAGTLAGLLLAGHQTVRRSQLSTGATVAAAQKIEQLRAAPPADSPGDALDANDAGYSDFLDAFGRVLGAGAPAAYVRRWSVASGSRAGEVTIAVRVVPAGGEAASAIRHPEGAFLATVVRRGAP